MLFTRLARISLNIHDLLRSFPRVETTSIGIPNQPSKAIMQTRRRMLLSCKLLRCV